MLDGLGAFLVDPTDDGDVDDGDDEVESGQEGHGTSTVDSPADAADEEAER